MPHYDPRFDLMSVLDQEIPYPEWMEADLYGDPNDIDLIDRDYTPVR